MGCILNPNNEDFAKLVRKSADHLFVDKTDFLSEMIKKTNQEDCFYCFTRPRRFGKTMTAKMLAAYYSKGCDSRDLFRNLKIAQDPLFFTHLNQYNVIYIDMNNIKERYEQFEKTAKIQDIVDFLRYIIVKELKIKAEWKNCIESDEDISSTAVMDALSIIKNNLREQFVFIMDEWDLVYREYKHNSNLQDKFINLLRGLFKADNSFSLAYLTGILPIKKYISESALNNFREYNMLRPAPYERFFGFTEEEVGYMANEHQMSLAELKFWYDGYDLNGTSILNPNSVINAICNRSIQSYWSATAAVDPVKDLLKMNFDGLKDEFLELLNSSKEIYFDAASFQNDMVSIARKDDVYSLLVCLGYLGCYSLKNELSRKIAYVPNEEIRQTLRNMVIGEDWFPQMKAVQRSKELLQATIDLDAKRVAQIIEDIHNSEFISLNAYNNESSLHFCISHGYFWATQSAYQMAREAKGGTGYADVIYVPIERITRLPVIIVELKYGKSASDAINQIKTRGYCKNYEGKYKRIILVGINYDKTAKKHECLIEELS